MNNKEIMKVALEQSARDYSISVSDLLQGKYTITKASEITSDARNYLKKKPYCNFIY